MAKGIQQKIARFNNSKRCTPRQTCNHMCMEPNNLLIKLPHYFLPRPASFCVIIDFLTQWICMNGNLHVNRQTIYFFNVLNKKIQHSFPLEFQWEAIPKRLLLFTHLRLLLLLLLLPPPPPLLLAAHKFNNHSQLFTVYNIRKWFLFTIGRFPNYSPSMHSKRPWNCCNFFTVLRFFVGSLCGNMSRNFFCDVVVFWI